MYSSVLLSVWKVLDNRELILFIFSESKDFLVVFVCFVFFDLVFGSLTYKYKINDFCLFVKLNK